jgi:hypothetical protein
MSAVTLIGPQLKVPVAVVDRVDHDARGDDLVDDVGEEGDVGGGQERLRTGAAGGRSAFLRGALRRGTDPLATQHP